jgi:cobalt-zinc-cadmium efflux system protein
MHEHDHDHDHAHQHVHVHPRERGGERRKMALTLIVTALILLAEVAGGLWSHSLALLSDAGHMFSDLVAQALSLVAMFVATRPSDARRTYGWYRVEILAALTNGATLFVLAAIVLWSGWIRLRAPVEVHTGAMLAVAAVGLVANLVGAWLLHDTHSLSARSAYLHLLLDTLSSVAVLLAGVVMRAARGAYWLDPLLSMAIGVFILYSAYRLMREAVDVLLEAVPRGIDLAGVTHAIDHTEGVRAVHDLHIWTITSGLYALSAHIVVSPSDSGHDGLLTQLKEMLQREFAIGHTTLQLESEHYDHSCNAC